MVLDTPQRKTGIGTPISGNGKQRDRLLTGSPASPSFFLYTMNSIKGMQAVNEIIISDASTAPTLPTILANRISDSFRVAWVDSRTHEIKSRSIGFNINPSQEEILVAAPPSLQTMREMPRLTSLGFDEAVVWSEHSVSSPLLRHLSLQKLPLGSPIIQITTTSIDPKHRYSLAQQIDGDVVISWIGNRADCRVLSQRLKHNGTKLGGETRIDTTDGYHRYVSMCRLISGNHVIVWTDGAPLGGDGVRFRIRKNDGTFVTTETGASMVGRDGNATTFTDIDGGRFVITALVPLGRSALGVETHSIECKVFDESGNKVSEVFIDVPRDTHCSDIQVAPLTNGRFALAWIEKNATTVHSVPTVKSGIFSAISSLLVDRNVEISQGLAEDRFGLCIETAVRPSGEQVAFSWVDKRANGGRSEYSIRAIVRPVIATGGFQ